MRMLAIVMCASLGFATTALAKDPPPPGEDKIICKRQQDADTGSHFATTKRVCLKKSEWKEMEEGAENTLRRVREQGGSCPACLTPPMGGGPG
jgi:hypothetical protein